MTDKEERILIIKITSDLYTCDIGGICKDKVCLKTLCEMGMTRQEAIRKMCDAYFKAKDKGVMESERVEAALNALLEGAKK